MTLALRDEGKKVVCWNEDPIPQKYRFLDPDGIIQKPKPGLKFDCVIATDCASFERLGTVGRLHRAAASCSSTSTTTRATPATATSTGSPPREPSTGELIFRLLKVARWPITKPHRRLPLHRRLHRHRLVPISHHAARHLSRRPANWSRRGADLAKICDEVYQSYPLSRARLLKHVYSHFRLTHDDRIAYFWLKKADFARTGADSADSEGLD